MIRQTERLGSYIPHTFLANTNYPLCLNMYLQLQSLPPEQHSQFFPELCKVLCSPYWGIDDDQMNAYLLSI